MPSVVILPFVVKLPSAAHPFASSRFRPLPIRSPRQASVRRPSVRLVKIPSAAHPFASSSFRPPPGFVRRPQPFRTRSSFPPV